MVGSGPQIKEKKYRTYNETVELCHLKCNSFLKNRGPQVQLSRRNPVWISGQMFSLCQPDRQIGKLVYGNDFVEKNQVGLGRNVCGEAVVSFSRGRRDATFGD